MALPGPHQWSGAPSCLPGPPEGGDSCSPGGQAGVERLKESELPALGAPLSLGTLAGERAPIQLPPLWALHPGSCPARPQPRRSGALGPAEGGPLGLKAVALALPVMPLLWPSSEGQAKAWPVSVCRAAGLRTRTLVLGFPLSPERALGYSSSSLERWLEIYTQGRGKGYHFGGEGGEPNGCCSIKVYGRPRRLEGSRQ